ncbi:MAG: mechanosensitive ion channel family protein [Oscillibacter sp.]|jgi:small conductance mechanosensitive channel|nr:mechanosensitive ion channel family protein [Oscillibacter sp.]
MSFSDLASKTTGIGKITWGDLLSAVLTALVCLLVIRIAARLLRRMLEKSKLDARVQKYLASGVKLLLYLIAAVIIIDQLGVDSRSLIALLSVGSLGLTLAAEDILGNMAGGLVILSSRPFAIGDFIESGGTSGTVEEITLNHTKLVTPDGLVVMIPNKALSDSKMTNYTVLGRRRVAWKLSASYDAPTETVRGACLQALSRTPDVLTDPAPAVYLTEYGSSAISYTVYCWCAAERYWDVYFTLGEQLRGAFADAGVEMTYDHLNVHLTDARSEKR